MPGRMSRCITAATGRGELPGALVRPAYPRRVACATVAPRRRRSAAGFSRSLDERPSLGLRGAMSNWSETLADRVLAGESPSDDDARRILLDGDTDVLSLVHAAFRVRKATWGRGVQVHIINNAANGHCPEDCSYCSQAKTSTTD